MASQTQQSSRFPVSTVSVLGSVVSVLVVIFTLYSSSPWTLRTEMVDFKLRVERLQMQVDSIDADRRERGARIAALEAKTGENERRLIRIEDKLDLLVSQRLGVLPARP